LALVIVAFEFFLGQISKTRNFWVLGSN